MSRTTKVLIAAAAVLTFYTVLVAPLEDKREGIREHLYIEHRSLEKHERFIKGGGGAKEQMEAIRIELESLEKGLIKEKDSSLAFATLQGELQDMAGGARIQVNSIKPLEPEEQDPYVTIPLLLDASSDIRGLSAFLKMLESSGELISLDKLSVSLAPQGGLRIKLQMSGLMKK